jgi:DNA repair protein RadA/Sms
MIRLFSLAHKKIIKHDVDHVIPLIADHSFDGNHMVKHAALFYCTNCDYRPPKWLGCCPECQEWGSIMEEQPLPGKSGKKYQRTISLTSLEEITLNPEIRMISGLTEWDRVMGGGIVPGSFFIVTGDPGIGKSTLLLQVGHALAAHKTVLYFSSEESLQQVKLRARRLNCDHNSMLFSDHAQLDAIADACAQYKPDLVIIDSIQNCFSTQTQLVPGTIGQLREAAFILMRLAKEHKIAIIVTGHITKEGVVAGPKMLEHMVDAVFYLQGEERWQMRILRSVKNRFGSINELGFFSMEADGLHQIPNINQHLINDLSYAPGSALISSLEGSRPLLLELQALTVPSKFGIPQRIISGVDQKQVALIAAILEKYLQIKLSTHDIFFKISGNFKIKESSADLGIALALLSSYLQKTLPEKSIALAEINLTGAIKPINQISIHLNETINFGLKTCFVAHNQAVEPRGSLALKRLRNVYELLTLFPE